MKNDIGLIKCKKCSYEEIKPIHTEAKRTWPVMIIISLDFIIKHSKITNKKTNQIENIFDLNVPKDFVVNLHVLDNQIMYNLQSFISMP